MEIVKNKTANFLLLHVLMPIVLSLVVAYAYDKLKARSETKASTGETKSASQPSQKASEPTETEVTEPTEA